MPLDSVCMNLVDVYAEEFSEFTINSNVSRCHLTDYGMLMQGDFLKWIIIIIIISILADANIVDVKLGDWIED